MNSKDIRIMLQTVANLSARIEVMKSKLVQVHIQHMEFMSSGLSEFEPETSSKFMDLLVVAEGQLEVLEENVYPLWNNLNSIHALSLGNNGMLQ